MSMTRKHFQLIADVIANRVKATHPTNLNRLSELEYIARDMATALATQNPAFDHQRFLDACGVQQTS